MEGSGGQSVTFSFSGGRRGGGGHMVGVLDRGGELRGKHTEIPTPLTPKSPKPKILEPSVTTQILGFLYGQFLRIVGIDLRCLMEIYRASGLVYSVEYCRHTSPIVGV